MLRTFVVTVSGLYFSLLSPVSCLRGSLSDDAGLVFNEFCFDHWKELFSLRRLPWLRPSRCSSHGVVSGPQSSSSLFLSETRIATMMDPHTNTRVSVYKNPQGQTTQPQQACTLSSATVLRCQSGIVGFSCAEERCLIA